MDIQGNHEKTVSIISKLHLENKAGRVVLIKSSLESLAVYFMSLHHLPVSVEKRLNTIMRRFLWGEEEGRKKMSWVSFKKIGKPKRKGGLGIRSLRLVNKSLLAKWHVRYCTEKNALWRRIMCEKTQAREDDLLPLQVKDTVGRSMWFGILREASVFAATVRLQVKEGNTIRFWQDPWFARTTFRDKYPRLYKVSSQKMNTVDNIFQPRWNFQFTKELDPAERIDLLEIKYEIRMVRLTPGEADCIEKEVTAKDIYGSLTESEGDWDGYRSLTCKYAPPKVLFLFWEGLHESIPTRAMLQERRIVIQSNLCLYCNNAVETLDHLFLHCSEVQKLWSYFLAAMRLSWVMPIAFRDCIIGWRMDNLSPMKKMVWQVLPYAVCWEVWNERNRRVHGSRGKITYELEVAIKQWILLWSSSTDIFSNFTTTQLITNWEVIMNL